MTIPEKPIAATAVVANTKIELSVNPNANKTALQHVISYAGTSSGVFRCLQLAERVVKLAIEALKWTGSCTVGFFQSLSAKLLTAWTSLSILRIPDVTTKAVKAIHDVKAADPEPSANFSRAAVKAVHDTAEAASMWGYSISWLTGSLGWKSAADVPTLIADTTDLQMSAEDLHLANRAMKNAAAENSPAEVQEAITHTQRNSLLKVMKAACSVASGILGMSLLVFGGPVLPAVALIALSLASTALAMMSHFYQETSPFKMIDFFDSRAVQVLPSAVTA